MSITQEKQNNLQQWLNSINCIQSFTQNDILNGMLIYKILLNVSPQSEKSTKQVNNSMTTLSRVTNWNILTDELKKLNINLNQQQKSKIIGGNQEIVIEIVSKLKQFHLRKQKTSQVDLTQIDSKKDIKDTKSLLQMFLILMMKNFHLSAKEAVALLSNQSNYLAHILTKGLKGQFKVIETFLLEMNKNLERIMQYCKQNEQNVVFFLRSIKPALISKSETVSSICLQFFNRYLSYYPLNQRKTIFGTHLQSTYLLTTKRHPVLSALIILYIFQGIFKEKKSKQNTKGDEVHKVSKEQRMKLRQKLTKEVFDSLSNDGQKFGMLLSVIRAFGDANKLREILQVQFFNKLIQKSIEAIKQKENTQICIDIVLSLCQQVPQLFSAQQEQQQQQKYYLDPREISLNLLESLKTCTSQLQLVPFSLRLFSLLQYFGQNKHFIAPNLYKLILQKFSQIEDTKSDNYQLYLLNFMEIIKQFPSIPWNPILQNILTRKRSTQLTQDNQVREVQLDFFLFLLNQQNIDIKNALIVFDYVSKLFIETYHLAGYLIKIIIKVIDLFSRTEPIVQQLTLKLIKVCLSIHHANTKKFSHKRKSLTGNSKTTDEEALMKIKNNSIQFFVFKVAQLQIDQINSKIEPLVAFNYIQMKQKLKYVKGFKKILEVFGDFTQIVERYENQIKKAEQEAKQLQRLQKISKQKQKEKQKMSQSKIITKAHSKSRYEYDSDSSKKLDTNYDEPVSGYKGQSFSMHIRPFNGTYLGITPSAQKGIQKFQKVYLNKIQKQDFQKIKKQEEQQKFEIMKKVYRKKIMSQYGIDIKGQTDQIQYLFQFDSLQDNEQKSISKVPFYTNETQEDRDMLACQKLLKTYQKPLKVIYSMYSGQKKGQLPQNFDEIAEKNTVISSTSLFKFLKDFGFQDYISLRQVQQLCQKINNFLNPSTTDYQILDFQSFIEFFKQVSFLMFTRSPKDLRGQPLAIMLEETFSNLKLFAGENKVNEQIFEEPNSIFFNETEAVAQLNKKLIKNPDYILPEGYKKIVDKRINFEYGIFLQALSVNYKVVFEVLDQLLFGALGVHVMQPFTREEKVTRARPALFVAERLKIDSMPARHIPVSLKKEIMRIPIKSRTQAKECAIVIDDIITAIEFGHDEIGQKHMNKVQVERKKQFDQEIRRFQQQKIRRQNRNRQAKSAIQQYKQKRDERQKQKSMKKQQQERKIKQQKQRKQKQSEELKKKIDQYNKKKKDQQEQKLKKKKQSQERQKKQREKFKQLNQETKRKIQEEKKKKQEEEKMKKAQREAEEKRNKGLEKKKLMESQIIKKKMVQEFKLRKSQIRDVGSTLNKSVNNQTNKLSNEINRSLNKELKNLQSYGGDSNNESRINE